MSGKSDWQLIDLDGSARLGGPAGVKRTSSAFWTPELARLHEFDGPPLKASVSLDMWQFGVLMFQLCSEPQPSEGVIDTRQPLVVAIQRSQGNVELL